MKLTRKEIEIVLWLLKELIAVFLQLKKKSDKNEDK